MELLAFGKTGWGDELFYATLMTIAVSVTAMLVGFVFALIFTPLKLSKYKSLNLIGNFYTTVIRGVPELLVIYLFFFGGSGAIMYVASIFGYEDYIEINAFFNWLIFNRYYLWCLFYRGFSRSYSINRQRSI
jgi:octopine/nopaline transport system permease protein